MKFILVSSAAARGRLRFSSCESKANVMGSQEKQNCQNFRWPSSGYERLLGASAVGRRMLPPCVGSAGTRSDNSENGHDFPSMIASEMSDKNANGNSKVAAGDAKSTSRRVHFSDQGKISFNLTAP